MKKLSKLICAVLVLALLCSSLIFTVSAEDAATDSEHDFEPNLIHSESSFSGVNTLFENVVASDVEGNLFSGSSTGNAQDILSVAGSDSEEFSYITFYANKDGSIEKKNPFYQLNAESPNISVEAGSSAYYVIDFDVATHGNILSYLDVSVMLRRVSDGGGFPFSANVPFAEYVSEDGTWSHVTVVGDIAANEVHIFVNGEYKATPGFAYNADQLSGNKSLSPKGIRIDFAISSDTYYFDEGDNVAFDNLSQRVYTEAELSGGLPNALAEGNLNGWSNNISGIAGKTLPTVAKVDGVEYNNSIELVKLFNSNDNLNIEFFSCPLIPLPFCANSTINTNGMSIASLVKIADECDILSTEGNIVTTYAPFTENISISNINTNQIISMVKAPNADNMLGISTRFIGYNTANMRGSYIVTDTLTGAQYIRDSVYSGNVAVTENVYIDWITSNDKSLCTYELGVNQYIVFDIDFAIEKELDDARKINLNPITRNSGDAGVWGNSHPYVDDLFVDAGIGYGEFAHITAVLSPDTRELTVFINGEYISTTTNAIASIEKGHYFNGFRMFSNANATANYDNVSLRSVKSEELAEAISSKNISAWSGNLYTDGYELPKYPAIATVDGKTVHSVSEIESLLIGNKPAPVVVKILHTFSETVTVSCDATVYTYGQAVKFVDPYGNEFEPVGGVIKYDAPYQANREEEQLKVPGGSSSFDVLKAIKGSASGNILSGVYFNSVTKNGYLWGTPGYRTASLVTNIDTGDVFYRESSILGLDGRMNEESNEYISFNFDTVTLSYEEGKNEYIVADFDFGTDGTVSDDIALQLMPKSGEDACAAPIVLRELHVNRGEMAHITLVFDLTENYAHVFINGKLAYSVSGGAMNNGRWESEYIIGTEFAVSELKLCSDQKTSTVCFDNVNIRAFENSTDDDAILAALNSGYITDWADSVYNADYVCCAIPTLAIIDGVEYGSIDEVNKILSAETEHVKNAEFKHVPASVVKVLTEARINSNTLAVKFDWNTGIYEFEMDDEWYASTETGLAYASSKLTHNVEGSLHIFETINQENCWYNATPVTWYLDGSLQSYDVVFYVYGDQIAPLKDRTYVKGNNLYRDQWKSIELTDDGYAIGGIVESYQIAAPTVGEVSFVYAPVSEIADFAATDLQVGAVVNTNIALTVYVAKSQTVSEGETVIIGGVEYVAITFDIAPAEIDKIVEAQFLVADADGNVYTQIYDIRFIDYAEEILKGDYKDSDKKVVANLLAYANEAHALFDEAGAGIEAVETLLDTYGSYVIEAELGDKLDTSNLASVIRSAALNLNSAPEFVFKVARGFRGTIEFSYLSLGEEVKVVKTVDARVAEQLVVLSGLNAYDLCGDITITVTKEGASSSITGQYNLASYAQSVENNSFAKALLAYSKAAEEYMNSAD